jgi:hypothetical protein
MWMEGVASCLKALLQYFCAGTKYSLGTSALKYEAEVLITEPVHLVDEL